MTNRNNDRHARRETFGSVAQQYDRWRPTYPAELFDDLVDVTALASSSVALEIGCGTGQVTEPLSRMVRQLHVVDLSAELIDFTRAKLTGQSNIVWHHTPFEELDLPSASCDVIGAWESFHWLDPDTRFQQSAELLTDDGWLVIVRSHELRGGTAGFFEARQHLYSRRHPPLVDHADVTGIVEDIRASRVFDEPLVRSFEVHETHTGESYAGLVGTFSDTLALSTEQRRALVNGHQRLIDEEFGGQITRRIAYSMVLAQKHPRS